MNWRSGMWATDGASHGKAFYVFIVALGLLGFACSVALSRNSDLSVAWGAAFAFPAVFFLLGMAQAVERLGWPERARERSAGLSDAVRSRILLGRFVALTTSLGGCIASSIAAMLTDAETQDLYDNFRIFCFLLLFACFCLADLAGDETIPSMLPAGWVAFVAGLGPKPKRRRPRRSLY